MSVRKADGRVLAGLKKLAKTLPLFASWYTT